MEFKLDGRPLTESDSRGRQNIRTIAKLLDALPPGELLSIKELMSRLPFAEWSYKKVAPDPLLLDYRLTCRGKSSMRILWGNKKTIRALRAELLAKGELVY